MGKYICSVCGYIYNEGIKWEELPEDWVCPLCGAAKSEFKKQGESVTVSEIKRSEIEFSTDMREMSQLEISALCSNLSRGCEKQYKQEEANLFNQLAVFFKSAAKPAEDPSIDKLITLIEKDLSEELPNANAVANEVKDRGALRALVWSEKVNRC